MQRALAVEALRQGARLGGHGASPLPAWAASLAALSVQAALVLPVSGPVLCKLLARCGAVLPALGFTVRTETACSLPCVCFCDHIPPP